jgi:hypothetical protein
LPTVALRQRKPSAEAERRRRRPLTDGHAQIIPRDVDP